MTTTTQNTIGITERIASATTAEEVHSLVAELETYKFASTKTIRRAARAAGTALRNLMSATPKPKKATRKKATV